MRRDLDLVRDILLAVENSPTEKMAPEDLALEGHDPAVVKGHVQLLIKAGYLDGQIVSSFGSPPNVQIFGVAWAGHNFIEAIRNDTVWRKTKAFIAEKGGGATLDIIKAIAVNYLKAHIGLPG